LKPFNFRKIFVGLFAASLFISMDGYGAAKRKEVELGSIKRQRVEKKGQQTQKTRFTRGQAFIVTTETQLLSEIKKGIRYLKRIYPTMPKKSTARLEMRERLVNLHMEAAVYITNGEMRTYDRNWNAWDARGRKGREPKLNTSKSKREWENLSRESKSVLKEYPRAKNADVVLFNLGLAQNFLKRDKEAARTFSQLIQKYPNSQKAGDAYFALGDFYFEKTDFRNAMNNYKSSLKFKRAKAFSWSLFKLGWCAYNLGNYKSALSYWKQTVSASKKSGKKGIALKEEALRDMVYAFAELKQVEPAIQYYKRNGGKRFIGRFLNLLANTFSDQGQYSSAVKTLKRFQQEAPYDEGAPDSQKEIILLNFELGKMSNVWEELARFPKLFGPKSRWAGRNKKNKKLYLETQQMIKDQVIYYAKLTHKNAQKNDNSRMYMEAIRGYKLFLNSYPRAKESAEVKYLMADIYYFEKEYQTSGRLFLEIGMLGKTKAVKVDDKTKKRVNIHKDSADGMLESYSLDFEPEYKVMLKRKPNFAKSKKPLTRKAKSFVKACGHYQKWYPQDKKKAKKCDVFITQVYYRSNDRKMSLKWLWLLAKKYPGSNEGNDAVESLIPLYKKDKKGLAAAAKELLKIPAYSRGKMGRKLRDLAEGLELDNIMAMKNRGKRGTALEARYKKNPRGKDSDKLIYNAAGDYLSAGMIAPAIAAYTIVNRKHPKSVGSKDAMIQLAKLNENRMELGIAATYYLQYSKKFPKDKFGPGSLAKACQLQAALMAQSAISTCLKFSKIDMGGAKAVIYGMMRSAYSAKQIGSLNSLVRTFNSSFRVTPAEKVLSYSMVYFINGGKGASAQAAASKITSGYRSAGGKISGEALRAVGEITFKRVNGEYPRYARVKLSGPTVDNLLKTIQAKGAALQKSIAAYKQVLDTGDSYWGVAALVQIAKSHEDMANQLKAPPQIKGAPYSDVVKQLSGDARAQEKEAIGFYRKALSAVSEFMVYNKWAAQAHIGLARMTGKSTKYDDLIVTPDFIGSEVPTSLAGAVKNSGGM
jgi:tetratricopeptide (TPR) repeat protein